MSHTRPWQQDAHCDPSNVRGQISLYERSWSMTDGTRPTVSSEQLQPDCPTTVYKAVRLHFWLHALSGQDMVTTGKGRRCQVRGSQARPGMVKSICYLEIRNEAICMQLQLHQWWATCLQRSAWGKMRCPSRGQTGEKKTRLPV